VVTRTPTTPATGGITVGGSCNEGGIAGTYGYAGGSANIACIPNVTATTAAPTSPVVTTPTGGGSISLGMACSIGGSAGTYQYSGGASMSCVANPVVTMTTVTLPPTCPTATPHMWTDGTCRSTRQYEG
jgi:hypothetical protein